MLPRLISRNVWLPPAAHLTVRRAARPLPTPQLRLPPVSIALDRKASSAAALADPPADVARIEPVLSPAIEVRDYQTRCIEESLSALARGVTRMGASLPTGSGKTTIFVNLLHSIPPRIRADGGQATRTLIIVNAIELARQTARQLQRMFPDTVVEVEQGKSTATGQADVTVATIQTLVSGSRLDKFDPDQYKCVIVDEAHHAVAKSYRNVLSKFNSGVYQDPSSPTSLADATSSDLSHLPPVPQARTNQVPIIGFSATFGRHDRMALSSVFEEIVYHHELAEMIETGWLSPAKFVSVDVDMDLEGVEVRGGVGGDYVASSLSEVVDTPEINNVIVATWRDRAADRRSTLVFAVDIQHVRDLTAEFIRHGVDARMIYGDTRERDRRVLLDDFRAGKFPVLVNCAVLTEGADVPNIDCVYLARPTRSRSFLTQMIGRGLRLSPGKKDCLVMDILGSVRRGMVVRPSLEGLSPGDIFERMSLAACAGRIEPETKDAEPMDEVDDEDSEPAEVRDRRSISGAVSVTGVTYTDYDSPFDLGEEYAGVRNMHHLSQNAWVGCGDDLFVLDLMGHGHFTVRPEPDGMWIVTLTRKFKAKAGQSAVGGSTDRFATPVEIVTTPSLAEAISAADTFASSRLHKVTSIMQTQTRGLWRFAPWRKQPASKQQKDVLVKRLGLTKATGGGANGKKVLNVGGKEWSVELEGMTKGQAANLLTRLSHGAKKRLEDRARKERAEEKEKERERTRMNAGRVTVGRLAA